MKSWCSQTQRQMVLIMMYNISYAIIKCIYILANRHKPMKVKVPEKATLLSQENGAHLYVPSQKISMLGFQLLNGLTLQQNVRTAFFRIDIVTHYNSQYIILSSHA